jgi:hypothetical protein
MEVSIYQPIHFNERLARNSKRGRSAAQLTIFVQTTTAITIKADWRGRAARMRRIIRIVVAALEVGLHATRRERLNHSTVPLGIAAEPRCRRARFYPDQARRQFTRVLQDLRVGHALAN